MRLSNLDSNSLRMLSIVFDTINSTAFVDFVGEKRAAARSALFLTQKSQIRTLPETSKMWLRKTFSLDVFHQLFAFFVQTKQNKSRSGPVMDRRMLVSIKRGTYSAEP